MDTKVIIKPSIARKLFHMGNELIFRSRTRRIGFSKIQFGIIE